jgi:hypothetical protein
MTKKVILVQFGSNSNTLHTLISSSVCKEVEKSILIYNKNSNRAGNYYLLLVHEQGRCRFRCPTDAHSSRGMA